MITIVDYGVGNIAALAAMFNHVGAGVRLSGNPDVIACSKAIALPGVGNFAHAMKVLQERDLVNATRAAVDSGSFLLGVCLGMQLLARHSEEGGVDGLGLIPADVKRIIPTGPQVKVPNMGWREVAFQSKTWMGSPSEPSTRYYFAHSYHMICDNLEDVVATVEHDGAKTAAVAAGRVYGVQFHPEKSHRFGMRLLSDFAHKQVKY